MTAQKKEIGHVVGWTVVLSPDSPEQERIEVSTVAEWDLAFSRTSERKANGWPRGGEFYTRVQGPDGNIDERGGANPKAMPLGTAMIHLPCKYCREKEWFLYRPQLGQQTQCVCENCDERE